MDDRTVTKPIKKNTKERKERAAFFRAMNKSARTKSIVECREAGCFIGYVPPAQETKHGR